MMDVRALLYVTDKVFKRAENARLKKDSDAAAEEVAAVGSGELGDPWESPGRGAMSSMAMVGG